MKNKILKITDRVVIFLNSLFLLVWVIGAVALSITGNKSYYEHQFEKNNTAEKLHWAYAEGDTIKEISYDKDDLDIIINKIIDYLDNKTDDMQVYIDGLEVFSNQAIYHMKDVKDLYNRGRILCTICFVLFLLGLLYMFFRYDNIKQIAFKHSLIALAIVGGIILIIGISMAINFRWTFTLFHKIIFPDPVKYKNAFFRPASNYAEKAHINNQLLTSILNLDIFKDAGIIIMSSVILSYVIWIFILFMFKHNTKKNKMNEA